MIKFVFILILFSATVASAQSMADHNFIWKSEQSLDLAYDSMRFKSVTFRSFGLKKFEMVQTRAVLPFEVLSFQGDWKDVSKKGEQIFTVSLNGKQGKIITGRDANGIYLLLDMTASLPEGIKQKFIISSMTVNE